MLNENMVKKEHLEVLWGQMRKKDIELKLAIQKMMMECYYLQNFDKKIIEFFLKKIIECQVESVCIEDIDLIHDFTKNTYKGVEMQSQIRQFYWKLISQSDLLAADIVESAIKSYCDSYCYE